MSELTNIEVAVAIITSLFAGGFMSNLLAAATGSRKRKTDEAEALSRISSAIRDEVRQDNADLRDRMDRIAEALIGLTDLLDELFPKMAESLHPDEQHALKVRISHAKRVT